MAAFLTHKVQNRRFGRVRRPPHTKPRNRAGASTTLSAGGSGGGRHDERHTGEDWRPTLGSARPALAGPQGSRLPSSWADHPARLIPGIPDLLEIGPRLVCGVEVPARHMLASPEGRCRWDAEVPELVVDPQRHRQLFPKCDHAADLYFCECADFDDSHPSTVHERVSPHDLVSRWQSDAGVMCPYHLDVGVAEGIPAFLRFVQSVRADDPPTLICPAELGAG